MLPIKALSACLCLTLLLFNLTACRQETETVEKKVRPIRAITLGENKALEEALVHGRARAVQSVDLSFRVSGTITDRKVKVGDVVRTGGLIATLDQNDFKVSVQNAQGLLDQAKAAVARAKGEYQRELNILKEDSGATSKTAVARKKEALDKAVASVKSARAAHDAASNQLSYTVLKSPIDGKVVATYVENHEAVIAKQVIARLLDNTQLKFDISVSEQAMWYVPLVASAYVIFDAFPGRKIPADVAEVGAEASKTTRTYTVTLVMDQPEDIEILAGMAGKAGFIFDKDKFNKLQKNEEIIIPVAAVFSLNGSTESHVWIVDQAKMTVSLRKVTTGRLSENGIVVTNGLEVGETIATAGVHFLEEGAGVRLLERSGADTKKEDIQQ